ncbi:hypothetical protein JRO89_XS03G0243400 [Xanthoceras sorbifolium]|uniref:3-hydroxyisobutyryl-CoA hydrolase n=1 Tax=Xanthoceras sorbifolium TaxID=99658 RepID=A0ABQ8IBK8_9ROSI|nr:hypothetical protein JRO89_XS03G0243400 [Xanthoceras sorbifolium]
MQRIKALTRARYSCNRVWFLSHHQQKSFSALPNYAAYDDLQDQVARLNRLYESWEENPDIGFVMMKGSGRAFCSGADVVSLYQSLNEGKVEDCKSFFNSLYKFAYLQGTYLKPHVAIMDGITMGCGGGISLQGMFRVATDKTVFAHPETQLGFHPDAGASFYLSRLPGYLGEYLALTGEKLNGVEMIACGLATHFTLNAVCSRCTLLLPVFFLLVPLYVQLIIMNSPWQRLAMIEERLGKLITDDPSVIESSLAQYGDLVYPDRESVLHKIETIDKCFSKDTVEEIIDALENEEFFSYDDWCKIVIKKLKEASPLSLKVTLQSIREGRFQSLDQCLAREYRMSLNGITKRVSGDFFEGVRARIVDKDFAPKWDPPRLEDVSNDMVDCYFAPLIELEPELKLPTALREPYI